MTPPFLKDIQNYEEWCFTLAAWYVGKPESEAREVAEDFMALAYLLGDVREYLTKDEGHNT